MHIVFLPSWYPSSPDEIGGSFFREQAIALQSSGLQVGVIAPSLRSLKQPLNALLTSGKVRRELDKDIPTYRASALHLTPRLWSSTVCRLNAVTMRLFEAYCAEMGRPDLLHVHAALPAGAGAMLIRERYGIPFVLSEHSSAYARGLVNPEGKALARCVAGAASRRFAVSSPFSGQLEEILGLAAGSFSTMPNPVNDQFLDAPISIDSKKGFTFLHISLLNENKNVATLVEAFAARFRSTPEVSLAIGGDGPTRPALQTLARELGVGAQISFLGKLLRPGVRAALEQCDAFVLPSRFETFGVVLVEAMAMGVPVIATRCGGPEDIISETSGLLVEVDDVTALGTAMQQMHQNRRHWDAALIREECRARFGAAAISQHWHGIYAEVLSQAGTVA